MPITYILSILRPVCKVSKVVLTVTYGLQRLNYLLSVSLQKKFSNAALHFGAMEMIRENLITKNHGISQHILSFSI